MAYNASKPADDSAPVAADMRENFRALKEDQIVDAGSLGGSVASAFAKLASPDFSGNPTAPTQSAGDNSTKLATTAYADNAGTPHGQEIFTASGTWTCPNGVTKAWITIVGGGGGGSDGTTAGSDGGDSSVGALLTATGGTGAPAAGGIASGGSPNGQDGYVAHNGGYWYESVGGSGPYGMGGKKVPASVAISATGYGSGGSGDTWHHGAGGSGGWHVDSEQTVSAGNYTVTVGSGGAGSGTAEAGTDGLVIVRY